MIIFGLIAYIGIVLLIAGYFIVKRMGDRMQTSDNLQEERNNEDGGSERVGASE